MSAAPVMDVLRLFAGHAPYVIPSGDGWVVRQDGRVVAHVDDKATADRIASAIREGRTHA